MPKLLIFPSSFMTVRRFLFLVFLCGVTLSRFGPAQASVALAPAPQFVSYLQSGLPNAFGCVFTYQTRTTTPQVTYTDSGLTQNPNPVPLSAGGTANIWFVTTDIYTVVVKTYGGINCAAGQTIYSVNGVANYYGLLDLNNTWYGTNTFVDPIYISASTFQIVTGQSGTTSRSPRPTSR
jgi:hypothetical protein